MLNIQTFKIYRSNHKNIIQYTGDALEIIPKINSKFDLIFLDADKENYNKYLEIIIPKLNKKGILISDNVLWHGKVLSDKKNQDKVTKRIDTFNKDLVENKNFQTFMLPIRDGLSISIKL